MRPDPTVAWCLLDRSEPEVLILVAGANPVMRPLQYQTWETFSVNWHTDVKIAFSWLREALLKPLPPGSRVPAHRRRTAEAAMNTGAGLWRCVILSVVGALAWWLS